MTSKSLWIDAVPASSSKASASLNATATSGNTAGGWTTATVVDVNDDGTVRVRFEDGTEQAGPSDGGVTQVGAVAVVTLDGSGRITQVVCPTVLDDSQAPVATGANGERILASQQAAADALAAAADAFAEAEAVRSTAQEAFDKAEASAASLESARAEWEATAASVGSLQAAVSSMGARVEAAEMVADDARSVASQARSAADAAAAAAAAAQSAADAASAVAAAGDATARAAAQAAQSAADAAAARADQAANLASSAEAAADAAAGAAETAQAQAASASTDAGRAQAAATAAQATAQGAQAAADTAAAKAATAQAAADSAAARAAATAQSALVGGLTWTSSWRAGSSVTLTSSEATTSNADTGNNNNRLWAQYVALPGGRTYRLAMVVSAEAAAVVDMGGYYGTAAGSYNKSLWPAGHAKSVPAGTARATYSQDFTLDGYDDTAKTFCFVAYLRGGGGLLTVHDVRIMDVTELVAAQQAADDAAAVAVTAKAAADAAAASALGAQATADAATAKATTASGLYTVSAANPTNSDGQGKPAGAVWEVRSGGTSLRRYVWGGSAWTQIKAGTDFIGEKAIGRAQIGDAAVGTAQVADASITDAKIGSLSVSKLTVTGGATIPVAVMQAIISDSAFLGKVLATSLTVTSDNLMPDPYFDTASSLWAGTALAFRSDVTYQGHSYAYRLAQQAAGASNMTCYGPLLQRAAFVPCTPGDRLIASSMWYCDGAMPTTGNGFSTQVYFYDSSKTMISGSAGNQTAGPRVSLAGHPVAQWFRVGGEVPVTVPDGAAYMNIRPTLYFTAGTTPTSAVAYVGHVDVHRQTPAVDITDGAVTAAKIQASEEMWAKIAAFGAVTTDMLTAGNATVTGTAVVGDLVGNTLRGGSLELTAQGDAISSFPIRPTDWGVFEGSDRSILTATVDSAGAAFTCAAISGALASPTEDSAGIQCDLDIGVTGSYKNCVITIVVKSSIAQNAFVMWRVNGVWRRVTSTVAANTSTAIALNYEQATLPDAIRIVSAGAAAHTITLTMSEIRLVFNDNRSALGIGRDNGASRSLRLPLRTARPQSCRPRVPHTRPLIPGSR